MSAPWIVEAFDVIEHISPYVVARRVDSPACPFSLQRREEAFNRSVVPTVAFSAHAACNAFSGEQALEVFARVLATLVGVMQQLTGPCLEQVLAKERPRA